MKIKKKKIKEEKNYIKVETSYKKICTRWIRFLIFFLQESLRPTFKTVYAHRKNHSGKSLIFWHKKV